MTDTELEQAISAIISGHEYDIDYWRENYCNCGEELPDDNIVRHQDFLIRQLVRPQ